MKIKKRKYKLLRTKVILKNKNDIYSKSKIKKHLSKFLDQIIQKNKSKLHGITIHLYQSKKHLENKNPYTAIAKWWPQGHNLSYENKHNIENKSTYTREIKILNYSFPKKIKTTLTRLNIKKEKNFQFLCES